jgi:putative transposase
VILDLFTRKVVGWAMRDHMRAELSIATLTRVQERAHDGLSLSTKRRLRSLCEDFDQRGGAVALPPSR